MGAGIQCGYPSPFAPGTIHLPLRLAAGHPLSQARRGGSQGLAQREGTTGMGDLPGWLALFGALVLSGEQGLGSWTWGCPI